MTQTPPGRGPQPEGQRLADDEGHGPAAARSRAATFDFGMVTRRRTAGDTDVLVLDRWTDPGVPDDTLADQGLEVRAWDLASGRYVNQNAKVTFDIPVREGTTFLLHHCVAPGEPLQTRSVTATELADAPEADRLVLVEIDEQGWAPGARRSPAADSGTPRGSSRCQGPPCGRLTG